MGDGDSACYRAIEWTVGDANFDVGRGSNSGQTNQLHEWALEQWMELSQRWRQACLVADREPDLMLIRRVVEIGGEDSGVAQSTEWEFHALREAVVVTAAVESGATECEVGKIEGDVESGVDDAHRARIDDLPLSACYREVCSMQRGLG